MKSKNLWLRISSITLSLLMLSSISSKAYAYDGDDDYYRARWYSELHEMHVKADRGAKDAVNKCFHSIIGIPVIPLCAFFGALVGASEVSNRQAARIWNHEDRHRERERRYRTGQRYDYERQVAYREPHSSDHFKKKFKHVFGFDRDDDDSRRHRRAYRADDDFERSSSERGGG